MRPSHILILIIVVIVIFGAAKLPDVARNLGKSLKIFKKEVTELSSDKNSPDSPSQNANSAPAKADDIETSKPLDAQNTQPEKL